MTNPREILDPVILKGYNNAGIDVSADLLMSCLRRLDTAEEVAVHNFVWFIMEKRIGSENVEAFMKSVADIIEKYSLRNLQDGKTQEK
jgi:hypothetical protein